MRSPSFRLMHFGSAVSHGFSTAGFPVKFLRGGRAAGNTDTRTHLANLERVLRRSPAREEINPSAAVRCLGGGIPALRIPAVKILRCSEAEEGSHLSHLLSDTPLSSPRDSIASRWREIHGCGEWSGLLDPLDADLRRELIRYGEFVHSAYNAFFHHSPSAAAADSTPHVYLPDNSYRLTRHLFATASLVPPCWLPAWFTRRTSWIGFVAVCDGDREICRMGRRDIVVALRGTATCLEWAENLRANLVPLASGGPSTAKEPKVECGFQSLYKTAEARAASMSSAVVEEVRRLVELYKNETLSVTVTGHSLGAALAVLASDELSAAVPGLPPVAVFSFGGPRVGNRAFADRVERNGRVSVLRVVNAHDLVTKLPAAFAVCGVRWEGYEHVGRELRVDSRVSPFLKPDADPACCHDLEAYLHLVDGLGGGGGGGGFRPTAKRSVLRLLSQQRSNVKKQYANRARALRLEPNNGACPGCLACPSS